MQDAALALINFPQLGQMIAPILLSAMLDFFHVSSDVCQRKLGICQFNSMGVVVAMTT